VKMPLPRRVQQGGNASQTLTGTDLTVDVLHGNGGNDTLLGLAGEDEFYIDTREGNDTVDGGADNDALFFNSSYETNGSSHAIVFDYNDDTRWKYESGTWTSVARGHTDFASSYVRIWINTNNNLLGLTTTDTGDEYHYLKSVERLASFHGSSQNDEITGGSLNDKIYGHGGNDFLKGGLGDDVISGGAGTDRLDGGVGGDDTYLSTMAEQKSNQYSIYVELSDRGRWRYNEYREEWQRGSEYTRITYTFEDGTKEYDYIKDFEKLDVWFGLGDDNYVRGSDGDDIIRFNSYSSGRVDGGRGNDTLYSEHSGGRNNIDFGITKYHISGTYVDINRNHKYDSSANEPHTSFTNIENYHWKGGRWVDNLFGNDGDDWFKGEGHNDVLKGRAGDDILIGDSGHDTLEGGSGEDSLTGGSGNDIFVLYQGPHKTNEINLDTVHDYSWNDKIRVYTETGTETNLAALQASAKIRWSYNRTTGDTTIYDTSGNSPANTKLMVLENYSANLTFSNFQVQKSPISFAGGSNAYEDNPLRDPSGQLSIDPSKANYKLIYVTDSNDYSTLNLTSYTRISLKYGELVILNGKWSYTLNSNHSDVSRLNSGETLADWITFYITNAEIRAGEATESYTRTLAITIHGATDLPPSPDLNSQVINASFSGFAQTFPWEGSQGSDVFNGYGANDSFRGNGGDDWIFGGGGNDSFYVEVGEGNDVLDGQRGSGDMLNKETGNAHAIELDMNDNTKWKYDTAQEKWVSSVTPNYTYAFVRLWIDVDGDGRGRTEAETATETRDQYIYLTSIERLGEFYGSSQRDIISGGYYADTIYGLGGNDKLSGRHGNDVIYGGAGNDEINGGSGNDILSGGTGNDKIDGGTTSSYTYNTYKSHVTDRPSAAYTFSLNMQDTTLYREISPDSWSAGSTTAHTYIRVSFASIGSNRVEYDYIVNIHILDLMLGNGNDVVTGGNRNDVIHGGEGNDTLNGSDGRDDLRGEGGIDTLNGGDGIDQLHGGLGNDIMNGGIGNDTMHGDGGSDTMRGGQGIDTMHGGTEVDYMYGDAGNDIMNGGLGGDQMYGGGDNDLMRGDGGSDTMRGGQGFDTMYGGTEVDHMYGDAGNDVMRGGLGGDQMYGGGDNDTMYGEGGSDTMRGGLGVDTMYGGTEADYMYGDAGNDTMHGGRGADQMFGGDNNDTMRGNEDGDTMRGGSGQDLIYGDSGNDTLYGESGRDRLFGGDHTDTLYGGTGVDLLWGGTGNDKFALNLTGTFINRDHVVDFSHLRTSGSSTYQNTLNGGNDKILVDIDNVSAQAINAKIAAGQKAEALNDLKVAAGITWTQNTKHHDVYTTVLGQNDATQNDTIIYRTNGSVDPGEWDMLMVIHDIHESNLVLTIDHFEVV
jgi:VCBS repeat-containing protein